MLYYPFFWQCVTAIGQAGRYNGVISNKLVIQRLAAEIGQLGSLERAARRVVASLREWGMLQAAEKWGVYEPRYQALAAGRQALEAWLLACALQAHPAQEIPFADLVNLPALFPFRFTLRAHDMRPLSDVYPLRLLYDALCFTFHVLRFRIDPCRSSSGPSIGIA